MKSEVKGVTIVDKDRKAWPTKAEIAKVAQAKGISCSGWNPDKGELKFECAKQKHTYAGQDTAEFSQAIDDVLKEFGLQAGEITDADQGA